MLTSGLFQRLSYNITLVAACFTLSVPMTGCGKKNKVDSSSPQKPQEENVTGATLDPNGCRPADPSTRTPAYCPKLKLNILGMDKLGGTAGRATNWSLKCYAEGDNTRQVIISATTPIEEIEPSKFVPNAEGIITATFVPEEEREGRFRVKCRDIRRCMVMEPAGTDCTSQMNRHIEAYDDIFEVPYKILPATTSQADNDAFFQQFDCEPKKKKNQGLKDTAMLVGLVSLIGFAGGVIGQIFSDGKRELRQARSAENAAFEQAAQTGSEQDLAALEAAEARLESAQAQVDAEGNNWTDVAMAGLNAVPAALDKFVPGGTEGAVAAGVAAILGTTDEDVSPHECLDRVKGLSDNRTTPSESQDIIPK